jgi:hypothetical protein
MLVLELVTDSLRRIGIIAESEDPSAEEGQDAVTRLNDLMFEKAEQGVDIGWNKKATTADTVVLPDGVLNGIKAELAELLAVEYGVELPPLVVRDAEQSRNRLLRMALQRQFQQGRNNSYPNGFGGTLDITTGIIR